jgi:hypothetical protein
MTFVVFPGHALADYSAFFQIRYSLTTVDTALWIRQSDYCICNMNNLLGRYQFCTFPNDSLYGFYYSHIKQLFVGRVAQSV